MKYSYYICPGCSARTDTMDLIDRFYEPTKLEMDMRPDVEWISGERLRCKCGLLNTWYSVIEISQLVVGGEVRA